VISDGLVERGAELDTGIVSLDPAHGVPISQEHSLAKGCSLLAGIAGGVHIILWLLLH
jgi:hypothetical protein